MTLVRRASLHRHRIVQRGITFTALFLLALLPFSRVQAMISTNTPSADSVPDVLILANGDQFTGTFVRTVNGTVTFHNETVGDINVDWAKVKELRTSARVSVIRQGHSIDKKTPATEIPSGILTMHDQQIVLQSNDHTTIATIPVGEAVYIIDQTALDKQLRGEPGIFQAWNGAITAGGTFVRATQNSYNYDGAISLVRAIPTVSWLAPRNRTTFLLNAASGRITQPAYTATGGAVVPEQITKTDIYHASLQRDQFFSSRAYYFGIAQLDHNYSQSLQLQQLYGAGLGWTVVKTPKHTLDLTANIQYVRQHFMDAPASDDKNLIGSTIAANYVAQLGGGLVFTQYAAFLPAFNQGDAYSAIERNTLTFPAYKNFRLVVGTVDSYLNSVPAADPPAKRNSFQLTFGLSYDIKSSY